MGARLQTKGRASHVDTQSLVSFLFDAFRNKSTELSISSRNSTLPFLCPATTHKKRSRPLLPQVCARVNRGSLNVRGIRTITNEATSIRPDSSPTVEAHAANNQALTLENLLYSDKDKTGHEKQLIWRAWTGMSDDLQATKLQLLESLLKMLQTQDIQDARRLRALLDAKYQLIDAPQRSFYSFWAHMILQETDIAFKHFVNLPSEDQDEYWQLFMEKTVEVGDWSSGVKLWHIGRHRLPWRGKPMIRNLLNLIPNLHTWQFLNVLPHDSAAELKSLITSAVIIHLAASGELDHAKQLVLSTTAADEHLSDSAIAAVVRAHTRAGAASEALALYAQIKQSSAYPDTDYRTLVAIIAAATSMSSIVHLENISVVDMLHRLKGFRNRVRVIEPYTTVMAAYARHGLAQRVDALFEDFISDGSLPDVLMFSTVVHVRAITLETTQAIQLFDSCQSKYGIKPDQVLYNILLHAFTDTLNVPGATDLFLAMLKAGHRPDSTTASTMIDLFAHTKDAEGAEVVFTKMLELGVKPNILVWGSLIHAYVEAGDMDKFRRTFDEFLAIGLRPNSEIMNILLKQLRKDGRSFEEMQRLVNDMGAMSIHPTNATHTQMMRALITENKLDQAVEYFQSLKSPNEFHYTLLMVGFVRKGTSESMDALMYYYNEMLNSGFVPSFVTLAVLMNAFVLRNTSTSAKQASELLDSLADWGRVDVSSRFSPRNVPAPEIYSSLLRRKRSGEVYMAETERIFKQFINSIKGTDGRPDIRTLTSLMSIYLVSDRVDDVQSLFVAAKKEADRLYRYALTPPLAESKIDIKVKAEEDDTPLITGTKRKRPANGIITQVAHGARFVLAAALSIFTTAMVRAGRISQVERVWAALPKQGYAFDVQNWNQYIQLQIGQGKIERACELITSNLMVDGGRVYKRTKYQLLAALETLKEESNQPFLEHSPLSVDTDIRKKKELLSKIQTEHERLLKALEA